MAVLARLRCALVYSVYFYSFYKPKNQVIHQSLIAHNSHFVTLPIDSRELILKFLLKAVTFYLLTTSIVLANTQFNKVGEARMEYLFWDVYDAVLFTPSGNYSAGTHPIKFKLTYLRDFEAKEIVKATNEQWEHIGKKELADKYDSKLLSIWPDIRQGDSLTLVTNEQGLSTFYHNDEKIGEINEPQFSSDFLAIWLDEKTSEPKLRKQLLGN